MIYVVFATDDLPHIIMGKRVATVRGEFGKLFQFSFYFQVSHVHIISSCDECSISTAGPHLEVDQDQFFRPSLWSYLVHIRI